MAIINPSEYLKLKADVDSLSNAVTDKHAEIESLRRQISETKTYVADINTLLAKEERELSRPGPLSRTTLSSEQFNEHKRSVTKKEAELIVLDETMVTRNRDLTMLQNDLGNKKRQLKHIRERTADAIADQAAKQIVESVGEPINDLMHAMVALGGKPTDHYPSTQELFLMKLGERIKDALCQGHAEEKFKTTGWIPHLQDANQHVEALLHKIYLAEQGTVHE